MMSMLNKISLSIATAGISLAVGGIDVMNIMLVSVTEITREIGTRKALVAKANIRFQFGMEAMFLSLIVGVIVIVFGIIISVVVSPLLDATASLNIPAITGCVIFSIAIGVFFGYYLANKASKLDPIEALRYE